MKYLFFALLPVFLLSLLMPPPGVFDNRILTGIPFKILEEHSFNRDSTTKIGATVIASGLDVPWEIAWGPDNKIWITEQKGVVSRIDPVSGQRNIILQIKDVWFLRTAGLLGMALHPDMKNHPYVFLNYTFLRDEKPYSRLVRYTWRPDTLTNPKVLMEIAANNGHSGSRLAFSEGKLFWATGDAASTTFAQDFKSPNGKILRLNIDGSIPSDNPVNGSPVWAMGFRNIQGMVFSANNKLYTSEHGDATDDEVNLIEKTKNYGWPGIQGYADNTKEVELSKMTSFAAPLKAWTPTIGPAGIDYYRRGNITQWNNSLLLVSLKGKNLRALKLDAAGNEIIGEEVFLDSQFGRLRDICISPTGDVYISTSNRDWNRTMGDPLPEDDRIIKISPASKTSTALRGVKASTNVSNATGYQQYCASCHGGDGTGLKGVFPPLKASALVKSGELPLIKKIFQGSAGAVVIGGARYEGQMPSFAFLKNKEIEEIANYVRKLQPDKYEAIDPRSVDIVRAEISVK
ncbi:PQQ-dependent sugar dehydrogenase [Daejeonella lutea]|uniref:Glucose/arabinose dehydrogenase, beta-propeller fold n=1 Tax=Daejeonella lutea TaxID=572036 RepID=A0A1T5A9F7_9SPHI|nr:PQQ-dependent sugar dehydrogenase [Daejeonella lutea]SKB31367.1 Glucose/arabinose dehydrogenase, beta-propeller fold [Daejeonella lutea]